MSKNRFFDKERETLFRAKISQSVKVHGCCVMCVYGSEREPQWAYSVGIPTTVPGAPEVAIVGLDPDNMSEIIRTLVALLRKGCTFEAGCRYENVLRDVPVYFGQVNEKYYATLFGQCQAYHRANTALSMLQLVWPDLQGVFPWEDGFDETLRDRQPLFFEGVPARQNERDNSTFPCA